MKDDRYWELIQEQERQEEEARWKAKCEFEKSVNKSSAEQRIYKSMKARGRIRKSHGKWIIGYAYLYCAIKENGYSDEQVSQIIKGMVQRGYIRNAKDCYGRPKPFGNYVIEKWVN